MTCCCCCHFIIKLLKTFWSYSHGLPVAKISAKLRKKHNEAREQNLFLERRKKWLQLIPWGLGVGDKSTCTQFQPGGWVRRTSGCSLQACIRIILRLGLGVIVHLCFWEYWKPAFSALRPTNLYNPDEELDIDKRGKLDILWIFFKRTQHMLLATLVIPVTRLFLVVWVCVRSWYCRLSLVSVDNTK